jgi:hypothetical protein
MNQLKTNYAKYGIELFSEVSIVAIIAATTICGILALNTLPVIA